ncbi:hypothetical protein JW960_06110 [candidate division KSB1 bacterium]|nr:hypothetical protein [candidate division KSB1 bacterium]
MKTVTIQYCFELSDSRKEIFEIKLDEERMEIINNQPKNLPFWAKLDFHQCPNCPLDVEDHPHCPLMANLVNIVGRFDDLLSYENMHLAVVTEERCIYQRTTAQRAISALMGLVIATSGCPHSVYFKPMARYHLPLASDHETIYRATSMYLLAQYFVHHDGGEADVDLKGLDQIYKNMHTVNTAIAERIRSATTTDSSLNALVMLDMFALDVPMVIKASLDEIRPLFQPYLEPVPELVLS